MIEKLSDTTPPQEISPQALSQEFKNRIFRMLVSGKDTYDKQFEYLRRRFLTRNGQAKKGDVPPPSYKDVLDAFSPEQIEIVTTFERPITYLEPMTDFSAMVYYAPLPTHVDSLYKTERFIASGDDLVIQGWRAWIAEGAPEPKAQPWDDLSISIEKRISRYFANMGVGEAMDEKSYAMLLCAIAAMGNVIDFDYKTSTILPGSKFFSRKCIPHAMQHYQNDGQDKDTPIKYLMTFYSGIFPTSNWSFARFRPAVMALISQAA